MPDFVCPHAAAIEPTRAGRQARICPACRLDRRRKGNRLSEQKRAVTRRERTAAHQAQDAADDAAPATVLGVERIEELFWFA